MAISWSYVRSEFWLLWKKWSSPLFSFCVSIVYQLDSAQLGSTRLNFLGSLRFPFTSFIKTQLYCSVILLPVILLLVIFPVIWCFPIWLTTSLSYPMAIFSANEIRTFFIRFVQFHKQWSISKKVSNLKYIFCYL